jgi:hypothetical protein
MTVRKLNENDYDEILCGWWRDWRKTPPPKDMLPENGTGGFIVYDGETPVCAGFMFNTNSALVWIEFIVSNINYKDKEKRRYCISLLDETITSLARKLDKKYVYSLLKGNSKSLLDVSISQGYKYNTERYNEMIKKIWEQEQR